MAEQNTPPDGLPAQVSSTAGQAATFFALKAPHLLKYFPFGVTIIRRLADSCSTESCVVLVDAPADVAPIGRMQNTRAVCLAGSKALGFANAVQFVVLGGHTDRPTYTVVGARQIASVGAESDTDVSWHGVAPLQEHTDESVMVVASAAQLPLGGSEN